MRCNRSWNNSRLLSARLIATTGPHEHLQSIIRTLIERSSSNAYVQSNAPTCAGHPVFGVRDYQAWQAARPILVGTLKLESVLQATTRPFTIESASCYEAMRALSSSRCMQPMKSVMFLMFCNQINSGEYTMSNKAKLKEK